MSVYSVSGDFGKVKTFPTCIDSKLFKSVDHISSAGWHNVNNLYQINRPNGASRNIILFTISGKGCLKIKNSQYFLSAGSVAIIPEQIPNAYKTADGCDWEFYWIGYYGDHSQSHTSDIVKNSKYVFDIGVKNIELLLEPIIQNRLTSTEWELASSKALSRILYTLLEKSVLAQYQREDKNIVNKIIAHLENKSDFNFHLETLSNEYHYSKEHIIRIFKKATGVTPYQYWQTLRFKKLCVALENRNEPISQIAADYGYKNLSSFSKQFKEFEGISPKEYRKLYGLYKN